MNTVIRFEPSGHAICLHTDAINLAELGKLTVRRASSVEFNETAQTWEVKIGGKVRFQNPIRSACLYWEREYFNRKLTKGETMGGK